MSWTWKRNSVVMFLAVSFLSGGASFCAAFDYVATPLHKALTEHPIAVVVEITERDGDIVTAVPIETIKGRKQMSYELPAVWRPGTEFTFGPIALKVGKKYLLLLRLNEAGRPSLSTDFAADTVQPVASADAPVVCAVTILHGLPLLKEPRQRERLLAKAWDNETKATKTILLRSFLHARDEATVPFLLEAMNAGQEHADLMDWSAQVIQRHRYKAAIPELIRTLNGMEKDDWSCLIPVKTLGKLQAKEAYEPIMETIRAQKSGDRQYFIQAVCYLEDPRSSEFLIETLQSYLDSTTYLNESWAAPLQHVMAIPDRKLQMLAVQALQRMDWFRAHAALAKVRELRQQYASDAEFRRVADATLRYIDR